MQGLSQPLPGPSHFVWTSEALEFVTSDSRTQALDSDCLGTSSHSSVCPMKLSVSWLTLFVSFSHLKNRDDDSTEITGMLRELH